MKRIGGQLLLLSIALLLSACAAHRWSQPRPRPANLEAEIIAWLSQNGAETNLLTSLSRLPPTVREYYGEIADRGGKFNAGCMMEPGVPSLRLIAAGRNRDILQVAVERGGIAHGGYLDIFVLDHSNRIVSTTAWSGKR